MHKQLLSITPLKSEPGPLVPESGQRFWVQINPSDFRHTRGIHYNECKPLGQSGNSPQFSAMDQDTISFSLVMDGTGVVDEGPVTPVKQRLDALSKVVFDYKSKTHEPNRVQLAWGSMVFNCRLTSFDTQFTLFKPNGQPLRARCELSFSVFNTPTAVRLQANPNSPDLSHQVLVKDGDTLPLLCQHIYGDASYYPEVAAFNGLRSIRELQPGQQLHFPPLR